MLGETAGVGVTTYYAETVTNGDEPGRIYQ